MKCILLWLLGFPTILFHCLVPLTLLVSFLIYKLYRTCCPIRRPEIIITKPTGYIERSRRLMRMARNWQRARHVSHMALVALLMLAPVLSSIGEVSALEQDAQIIQPFADLAKSIIRTATLGAPLEINIGATDLVRSLGSFAWRSRGFPVAAMRDFIAKGQDFYNQVKARVDQTQVNEMARKPLAELKVDLDTIVDSIVDEVRQSSDGLFTNYLETRVNGVRLEEACVALGSQLKAYGIDLMNYRNIAGAVLGVPLMPQIASSMVSVAHLAPDMSRVRDAASNLANQMVAADSVPGAALNVVSHASSRALGTVDTLRNSIPFVPELSRPLASMSPTNLFNSMRPPPQPQAAA